MSSVNTFFLMFATLDLAMFVAPVEANLFLEPGRISTMSDETLLRELIRAISPIRLDMFESALGPTYSSLPKDEYGRLGHQAVRYVLHRLFVQRRSWYIRGLEPSDEAPPPYLEGEWIPSYLQGLLEQRLGESGIDLRELAALAATLEDLVHREASVHLESVYQLHGLNTTARIDADILGTVLRTYMMLFLHDGNFTYLAPGQINDEKAWFATEYTDWSKVEEFLDNIQENHVNAFEDNTIDFGAAGRIVGEIIDRFGTFNDRECRALKSSLLEIEDKQAGRVRLSDFYKRGLYSHWRFTEKIGYLRAIGALDESDPSQARVIIPNYASSRTNCLEASSLYAVCCRNECETLLGLLEQKIRAPVASPDVIVNLVSEMGSDTVEAPRNLSAAIQRRLLEIAASSTPYGQIPLHGRLFAQWMHHAFPRECPYPHVAGSISPQTPDEWMRETGDDDTRATEEEMMVHVGNDTCGSGGCAEAAISAADMELPWSHVEELITPDSPIPRPASGTDSGRGSNPNCVSTAPIVLHWLFVFGVLFASIYAALYTAATKGGRRQGYHCCQRVIQELIQPKSQQAQNRQQVVLLCTMIMLANFAGLLDKAAFGMSMIGGSIFVVVSYTSKGQAPRPVLAKPQSSAV